MKERQYAMKRLRNILCMIAATMIAWGSVGLVSHAESVRVAVIDTGISTNVINNTEGGMNYIRPQDDTEDKLGHGTAVAGIIQNICEDTVLIPLVWNSVDEEGNVESGDTSMVAQAIFDAVDVYECKIINISSGSTVDSKTLKDAVEYAKQCDVIVVSSAGNSGKEQPDAIYYPGGYDWVICVGAADESGKITGFSQKNDTIDLLALGVNLKILTRKGTRIRGEGTSYSSAIVAGACAKIWAHNPELTAEQVEQALLAFTRTVEGYRVLDMEALGESIKLSLPKIEQSKQEEENKKSPQLPGFIFGVIILILSGTYALYRFRKKS